MLLVTNTDLLSEKQAAIVRSTVSFRRSFFFLVPNLFSRHTAQRAVVMASTMGWCWSLSR